MTTSTTTAAAAAAMQKQQPDAVLWTLHEVETQIDQLPTQR
jgi:hypothetical protein